MEMEMVQSCVSTIDCKSSVAARPGRPNHLHYCTVQYCTVLYSKLVFRHQARTESKITVQYSTVYPEFGIRRYLVKYPGLILPSHQHEQKRTRTCNASKLIAVLWESYFSSPWISSFHDSHLYIHTFSQPAPLAKKATS